MGKREGLLALYQVTVMMLYTSMHIYVPILYNLIIILTKDINKNNEQGNDNYCITALNDYVNNTLTAVIIIINLILYIKPVVP